MSLKQVNVFISIKEFNDLCDNRLQEVRSKLVGISKQLNSTVIDGDAVSYVDYANHINELMMDLARVKMDMEDVVRRKTM